MREGLMGLLGWCLLLFLQARAMLFQFPSRQLGHEALPLSLAARGRSQFVMRAFVGVSYPRTSSLRFWLQRWYPLLLKFRLLFRHQ
ncbi:hypothetical protein [Mumia zhuanghuii]|uniref:Uncharacterized protein n=1 Tax=Mumia zhuanghuii TaxID=2585211 RepID=A0A5C4M5J1_9ACTN|nr:hypothetical protein [Mumia zhuanghuii]TNC28422.1 hypothetical protein FHE65_33925 [Mumia zhuanghuii]